MDNREAKFILSAYRPGGQDADDPRFAEALAHVKRDPVLERWFCDAVAFDAFITKRLCSVSPPADLRDNILTGGKISRPIQWRWRFRRLAIAAGIIAAVTLGSLILRQETRPRLARWQTRALDVVSSLVANQSKFDAQSRDADELVAWLRANHAPSAQTLPQNLQKLQSLGCKTFSWKGQPVSVICFARPDGGLIHLIMMNTSAESNRAIKRQPRVVQQDRWATATWREGEMTYMLALEGSSDQLRTYLL
jgi:hypothetical protein